MIVAILSVIVFGATGLDPYFPNWICLVGIYTYYRLLLVCFPWRMTKSQLVGHWFGVVHWLKHEQYRRNKSVHRRRVGSWYYSLQGGVRNWELGQHRSMMLVTDHQHSCAGETWHLCVETSLYFTDAETGLPWFWWPHVSHFSLCFCGIQGMGRMISKCPSFSLWSVLSIGTVFVQYTRDASSILERSLPVMDKQDGAVWGSEIGWKTLWAACQVALLTSSWGQTALLKARTLT